MCEVEGCKGKVYGRGMCRSHYMRNRRHGDPLGGGRTKAAHGEPTEWLRTHTSYAGDDCLVWTFSRNAGGYGHISRGRTTVMAHREMCEIVNGPPPTDAHQAAHNCGNGHLGCVHPKHLRWDTPSNNNLDKHRHGTMAQGERNGFAKLTSDDVIEIRRLKGSLSQEAIGKMFGVGQSIISEIHRGTRWRHVPS